MDKLNKEEPQIFYTSALIHTERELQNQCLSQLMKMIGDGCNAKDSADAIIEGVKQLFGIVENPHKLKLKEIQYLFDQHPDDIREFIISKNDTRLKAEKHSYE